MRMVDVHIESRLICADVSMESHLIYEDTHTNMPMADLSMDSRLICELKMIRHH